MFDKEKNVFVLLIRKNVFVRKVKDEAAGGTMTVTGNIDWNDWKISVQNVCLWTGLLGEADDGVVDNNNNRRNTHKPPALKEFLALVREVHGREPIQWLFLTGEKLILK